MSDTLLPAEVARETLKQLALRKTAPTPDNYRALYHEIAGSKAEEAFPERALKQISAALPRNSREALRLACAFEEAVGSGEWAAVRGAVVEVFAVHEAPELNWASLLRDLIGEWDRRQAGFTQARKREMLERVFSASGSNPERLFERLQGSLRAWTRNAADDSPEPFAANSEAPSCPPPGAECADGPTPAFAELLARLLDGLESQTRHNDPHTASEVHELAETVRGERPSPAESLRLRLDKLIDHLVWRAEDQCATQNALQHVLKLIVDNIHKLVIDDRWLHGQMVLLEAVFAQPLDLRTLAELESRLRDVINRQGTLKDELNDAQAKLREMLARFVDGLGDFSESTGDYHRKIERCAERIASAENIAELTEVIAEVMRETLSVRESTLRSRSVLQTLRERVDDANHEISRLQSALEQTSELIRHDALTGVLNRKGLDDAIARESALAQRRGTDLCFALLDVDNFKLINDAHGHQTGDEALQHLTEVIRENVRPQDSVARYGGEEFVILLPDTSLEESVATLVRLQRALTKRFFLAREQHLLITFSAGVAHLAEGETPTCALGRADKAMYLAKRRGKNRVVAAGTD